MSAAEGAATESEVAEDAVAVSAVEDAVAVGAAEDAVAVSAAGKRARAHDAARGKLPDDRDDADLSEGGDAGPGPRDEVSDALSVFWAASDAVDRSNAAALGDSDDDAPADTWFDPSIGDSLDDLVDVDDADEPSGAKRSNGPRAVE